MRGENTLKTRCAEGTTFACASTNTAMTDDSVKLLLSSGAKTSIFLSNIILLPLILVFMYFYDTPSIFFVTATGHTVINEPKLIFYTVVLLASIITPVYQCRASSCLVNKQGIEVRLLFTRRLLPWKSITVLRSKIFLGTLMLCVSKQQSFFSPGRMFFAPRYNSLSNKRELLTLIEGLPSNQVVSFWLQESKV